MPLSLERYERLRALFDAARSIDAAEREAFIEGQTPGDDTLCAELKSMLATTDCTSTSRDEAAPATTRVAADDKGLGVQVGRYRLLRELGRGGMGAVYLAVRNDDVFRKVVALKVIAAGVVDAAFVARFKQERQILAALDHPNVARILDGGDTGDGRPFYVMEHITGVPIDEHCLRFAADVTTRLRLFHQVCLAVEYLHEQSVVHRDIKPSNVMVTPEGVVKLLDFGIAKVQAPSGLGPARSWPAQPTMILTPGHASPEQVSGGEITRRSDVYSLGVLLYQLLTGVLPFRDAEGRPDMGAQLSGKAPMPPSRAAAGRPSLGSAPHPSTTHLRLARDIDFVTLAALEPSPAMRLPSATALREEIERLLEGRPVMSRRHRHWLYRARLFVVRNRVAAALLALVALVGTAGGAVAVRAAIDRARLEARAGELERFVQLLNTRVERWAESAEQVPVQDKLADVEGANQVIASDVLPALTASGDDPARAERLVGDVRRFLDRAYELSRVDETPVRQSIATTYKRVGNLEARDAASDNRRQRAASSYERAATIAASVGAANEPWVRLQLSDLQALLGSLGRPLDVAVLLGDASGGGGGDSQQAEAAPVARPAPARARVTQPATSQVPAVELEAVERQLSRTFALAEEMRRTVTALRQRLEADGQILRADIVAGMGRTDAFLQQAAADLGRQDVSAARENLRRATYALDAVGGTVGR